MQPTLAEIRIFGGNFAPRGWALCQGQLLSISQNQALFSLLGTMYGGDGRTTFGLPDMRGRVPVSAGRGPGLRDYREGQKIGTQTNNMTTLNMPSHTHTASGKMQAAAGNGDTGEADGNSLAHQARGNTVPNIYNSGTPSISMANGNVNVTTAMTGNSANINNLQPYLAVNFIICLQGLFPSRS